MKNSSQINSNLTKANNNLNPPKNEVNNTIQLSTIHSAMSNYDQKDNQVNMQTDMDLIPPKDNWDDPPPKPPNSQLGPQNQVLPDPSQQQ